MRKFIKCLTLLLTIILLVNPIPVRAASKKDVKQITKVTNNYMLAVKQYNRKKISDCLYNKKFFYWIGYSKLQKYIKTINQKHYSYKIKSIKVNGNSATVTANISFYSSYDDSKWAMKEVLQEHDSSWSGSKTIKRYSSYLSKAYKDNLYYYEPEEFQDQFIFHNKTLIPFKKVNGRWKIEKVTKKMQWQMDGVTYDFMEDFTKDPTIIFD